jgi:HEAT repeat protein
MQYQDGTNTTQKRPIEKPTLLAVSEALKSRQSGIIPGVVYYGLSDLDAQEVGHFKTVWNTLSREDKQQLLSALLDASETNFELNYHSLGFLGLDDPESAVREAAIDLLWEDESLELMSRLIEISEWDENPQVRAAAVRELGRFILLGEYEQISETEATRAQDVAIGILHNEEEDIRVRRRALEAISNSSHEIVPGAILQAYEDGDHSMLTSALFAMGRSCDKRWREIIMKEIRGTDPEVVYEATRSAGELELKEAVPALGRLAIGQDRDIQLVAVWALGEIGGREAQRLLNALVADAEEANDEALLEAVEDALSNSVLGGDLFDDGLDD